MTLIRHCIFTIWVMSLSFACHEDLTSENPNQVSTEPASLILWHALRGADHDHLKADLAQFQKQTGLLVKALQLPHQAFANKLQVSIPRGNGPDIFIGPHDRVGDWAEAGHIEAVSYWVSPKEYQRFMSSPLEAFTYKKQLYGLPLSCKALALFYNPQLVTKAPQTLTELVDVAKRFQRQSQASQSGEQVWGLAYPELDSLYFHAPWLHAFGATVLDQGQVNINHEAMHKSVALVKKLRDQGLIPPEIDGALASELFRQGKLAFLINGPWFIAELTDFDASRWAVAPLPALDEGLDERQPSEQHNKQSNKQLLRPYLSVEGVMLSAYSKQMDKAWQLAQFLASPELANHRQKRGELIAYKKQSLAPYQATQDHEFPAWQSVFQEQIQSAIPLSNDPQMKGLWTPMKRALGQSILYGADIKESFTEAEKAVFKQSGQGKGAQHD